jgi:hypothetical protein
MSMLRSSLAAAVLIASLAACGAEGADEPATPEPTGIATEPTAIPDTIPEPSDAVAAAAGRSGEAEDGSCGADKLARWRNVLPTDEVKAEIAATVGERPIRYIAPGDAVTLDFSPSRLNVELGKDGRIMRFRCG